MYCAQVYNAYQTLLKGLASMLQTFHGIAKSSAGEGGSQTAETSSGVPNKQLLISATGSTGSGRSSVDRDDGSSGAGVDPSVILCISSSPLPY